MPNRLGTTVLDRWSMFCDHVTMLCLFSHKMPSFSPLFVHIAVKHFLSECYASDTVLSPIDTKKSYSQAYRLARATDYSNHRNTQWQTGRGGGRRRTGSFENMRGLIPSGRQRRLPCQSDWTAVPKKGRKWPSESCQDARKARAESGPFIDHSPLEPLFHYLWILIEVADFPCVLTCV